MSTADTQVIRCQCGAKLRVPAAAAGRRVKCPKCEFKIQVPNPGSSIEVSAKPAANEPRPATKKQTQPVATAPPVATGTESPPSHDDGLLDDLANLEQSAEATETSSVADTQKDCPECGMPMPVGEKACPICGHDPNAAAAQRAAGKAQKAAAVSKVAVAGSKFTLGCVLSAAGALLGAGVWYGVAIYTGFEIGYIAWGVGLAAGFGMVIGYGDQDFTASLVATLMALGGIFAAKIMIYNAVLGPAALQEYEQQMEAASLAYARCDASYDKRGVYPYASERDVNCDVLSETVFESEGDELDAELTKLTEWRDTGRWEDAEFVRATVIYERAYEEWDQEEASWDATYAELAEEVDAMAANEQLAEAKQRLGDRDDEMLDLITAEIDNVASEAGFWGTMFGPIDALFVLLALGSAMKIGGGLNDE